MRRVLVLSSENTDKSDCRPTVVVFLVPNDSVYEAKVLCVCLRKQALFFVLFFREPFGASKNLRQNSCFLKFESAF